MLPVELSSFASVVEGESVILDWRTETETNNAGFSVEHADGEGQFSEIAFVDGHGTTTKAQAYSFRVSNLDVGLHRFRLRQIDFDGAFEYSEEIETVIELAELFRLSAAYPNPFNPSTTFELTVAREQQVHVTVVNTLGQNVRTLFNGIIEANETANFVFDAAALPTGLYFYSVRGETFAQTRQVMFVK